MTTLLALAMVAMIAAMVFEQLRQHRRLQAEHARLLDWCQPLLEDPVRGSDPGGLPILTGRHAGREVRLDVLIDALALRKLPRLLLRGAVHRRLAVPAPVFVQRPTLGSGMLEGDRQLERELPTPAGWPDDVIIRTTADGPDFVPEALRGLGELFEDERTASVLAAPRGLRVTWEVARGQQAAWRVSRGARFVDPVDPAVAEQLLTVAGDLSDSLPGGPAAVGTGHGAARAHAVSDGGVRDSRRSRAPRRGRGAR